MAAVEQSNTLGADFCVEVLEEALAQYGRPKIFNTDQGCQFTSDSFTGVLERGGITISMDGKGRCMDNIFVERLWRSLKHEEVYLHAYASVAEAKVTSVNLVEIRDCGSRRPDAVAPVEGYLQSVRLRAAIDGMADCAAGAAPLSSPAPDGAPLRGCGA